jgi:signal transduction histidine kinase
MANLSRFNPFTYISDSGQERFAVGRVNNLLARIFSIGGLAVGLQMLLNAWAQRELLNSLIFWPGFVAVTFGQLGLIYGAFVSGRNRFWQSWYAISIALVIITWFAAVPNVSALPEGFYPWAWWGVGLSAVGAFSAFPAQVAIVFYISLDIYWFVARFTPGYGEVDLWLNLQDTVLTFLFATLLGSLILVTRYEASKVDEASNRKIEASANQARAEARTREKSRLDALVHDKVLTTLALAAKAKTAAEATAVSEMAIAAITSLNDAKLESEGGTIAGESFLAALEKIALAQDENIEVSRTHIDFVELSHEVATALTEAMLQAIVNSQQHAGAGATRELYLKGHRGGLKVVVKDNGRGFRMSRVPKNRLGVRVSIVERLEMVGGRAFIDSRPGAGASIILEWGTNA